MTREQYDRWKDFSMRMASTCFKGHRKPSQKRIVEMVADFFEWVEGGYHVGPFEDYIAVVQDWDHCDDWLPTAHYYDRKYRCPCWHCSKLQVYGVRLTAKLPDCPYGHCDNGSIYDVGCPEPVCDFVSYMAEHWMPRFWDDRDTEAWDRRNERWMGPPSSCIRAGLDCACSPSAGVMGFTAGDVRRMYPKGVPEWVFPEPLETVSISAVVPGVGFVPEHTGVMTRFADLPDDEPVWL